jgi:hypothetical protein
MFKSSKKRDDTEPTKPVDKADQPEYVLKQYDKRINYYWAASRSNKRAYKRSRRLVVVFGAVLTLIASLASANFVSDRDWLDTIFAIATPVLAAVLAIITGLSQSFQWGSAWREMVLAAQTLQQHRDRIALLEPEDLDASREIERLNQTVRGETQQFFERVTGAVTLREEPRDEQSISPADLASGPNTSS